MQAPAGAISRSAAALVRLAGLPARLAGPILTKELRVSSRRRRNFVLRAVYLAALTAFVALVWLAVMEWGSYGSHAYRIAHMWQAGRTIVGSVVWFQFCAVLLVTVIMLSTSISEEIYHRTLGVLMTTPVNSFQIVVGKLASKMLQLVVLLATSLPLLAVVRVLGGVPWDYVVAALCVTLTTAVFFAAVTMFFSILFRRAFVSILLSLCTTGVLYGGLPLIVVLMVSAFRAYRNQELLQTLGELLVHTNPFALLGAMTMEIVEPRSAGAFGAYSWWINCAVSLGLSASVLAACVAMVRRVALRQAAGAAGAGPRAAPAVAAAAPTVAAAAPQPVVLNPDDAPPSLGPVRPVYGCPVLWRELRAGRVRRKALFWSLVAIGGGLLLVVYVLVAANDALDDGETHAVFLVVYAFLGTVATAVLAATSITAEKEANSWEILLCTTLSGWRILLGKAAGIVKRCTPLWALPVAHVLLFMMIGYVHPALMPHVLLVATSIVALLAGSGLYFGSRVKRTTTAVILNLSLAIALWGAVPGFLALATEAAPRDFLRRELRRLTEYTVDANPIFQMGLLTQRLSGECRARKGLDDLAYYWAGARRTGYGETTAYLAMFTGGYVALAALLAWRAKRRFRR